MKEIKVVWMVMVLIIAAYRVFTLCQRVHIHPHIDFSQYYLYEYTGLIDNTMQENTGFRDLSNDTDCRKMWDCKPGILI